MEILDEGFVMEPRGPYGKYTALYDEILRHPTGTVFQLVRGEDFEGDPQKFVSALRTGLWNRGWRTNARIVDGVVYVKVPGPKSATPRPQRKVGTA